MDAVKVIKKSGAPGAVPAVTAYVDEPLLPKVSAEDVGKLLGVDENGEIEAVTVTIPTSKKYYKHVLTSTTARFSTMVIISDKSDAYTIETLNQYLTTVGGGNININKPYPVAFNIELNSTTEILLYYGIYPQSTNAVRHVYRKLTYNNGSFTLGAADYVSMQSFTDTVTEL